MPLLIFMMKVPRIGHTYKHTHDHAKPFLVSLTVLVLMSSFMVIVNQHYDLLFLFHIAIDVLNLFIFLKEHCENLNKYSNRFQLLLITVPVINGTS